MRPFVPMAIVGEGCLLPQASDPEALFRAAVEKRSLITDLPEGRWGVDPKDVAGETSQPVDPATFRPRGGFVRDVALDVQGARIDAEELLERDPLASWIVHAGRRALRTSGYEEGWVPRGERWGLVVGNLSYPTEGMARFAENWVLDRTGESFAGPGLRARHYHPASPQERFMSGAPVHLAARALGTVTGVLALDAACASSLYALSVAAHWLSEGVVDGVVVGAVNRADNLFLHMGFRALGALSTSGICRPFDRRADGLLPSEGAAMVTLVRLEDAVRQRRPIRGVLRGLGLSNDGRGRGVLAPSSDGQVRAMRMAYEGSRVDPESIDYVECHATGTPVGDRTEVESLRRIFGHRGRPLVLGTLKATVGHLMTVAGVAGILKVLGALRENLLPPAMHCEMPIPELGGAQESFRLLSDAAPWARRRGQARRAAVSAFGFGGNNAHAIVEEWLPETTQVAVPRAFEPAPMGPLAVVSVAFAGLGEDDLEGVSRTLAQGSMPAESPGLHGPLPVDARQLRIPPNDLRLASRLQILALEAARKALGRLPNESWQPDRTSVILGMGCDFTATDHGIRFRLASWARAWKDEQAPSMTEEAFRGWLGSLRAKAAPALDASMVLGCMPNLVANRVNVQVDGRGPSFTVSAEENSGLGALRVALSFLASGMVDVAVVGAVDSGMDPRALDAFEGLGAPRAPAEGAVVFVVMTEERAKALGLPVLALVEPHGLPCVDDPEVSVPEGVPAATSPSEAPAYVLKGTSLSASPSFVEEVLGSVHGAAGLEHLAAATAMVAGGFLPADEALGGVVPWVPPTDSVRRVEVVQRALGGGEARVRVSAPSELASLRSPPGTSAGVAFVGAPDGASLREQMRDLRGRAPQEILEILRERAPKACQSPARCSVVFSRLEGLVPLLEQAIDGLGRSGELATTYAEGEVLAFAGPTVNPGPRLSVFGGASPLVAGAGREFFLRFPWTLQRLAARLPRVGQALRSSWMMPVRGERVQRTDDAASHLLVASARMQAHAVLSAELFGGPPKAVLGYSLGEANALLAAGVWDDLEGLLDDVEHGPLFRRDLWGDHEVARGYLREQGAFKDAEAVVPWKTVTLGVSAEAVRSVLAQTPHAFLTLIHTDDECVVAGAPSAVDRVVAALGVSAVPAVEVPFAPCIHCPPAARKGEAYRALHHRPVRRHDVVFYSHGTGGPCPIDREACADALLAQGLGTVDFPALVRRAYDDGYRLFVDHTPRGLPGSWIGRILEGRPHQVVALDGPCREGLEPALRALASLFAMGTEVKPQVLVEAMASRGRRSENLSGPSVEPLQVVPVFPTAIPLEITLPSSDGAVRTDKSEERGAWAVGKGQAASSSMEAGEVMAPAPRLPSVLGSEGREVASALVSRERNATRSGAKASSTLGNLGGPMARAHLAFLDAQRRAHDVFLEGQTQAYEVLARGVRVAASSPTPRRDVWLGRRELERLAEGPISEVLGSVFARQDGFTRQVRMPGPPLLFCDRVLYTDAKAGELRTPARIVTETDVTEDAWYLHENRIPPGVLIEAGQADLLLASYMGVDFENRGERVYRLLGCDLMYSEGLPEAGSTLRYDIHIDGFANHGATRIFFFHSEARTEGGKGKVVLSVREGQAGFFSDEELAQSQGVLWDPERDPRAGGPMPSTVPPLLTRKRSLSKADLEALTRGDVLAALGEGFEETASHSATPRPQGGPFLLMDRVTHLDAVSGPWKRGYLRGELDLSEASWFFEGHFKDDPCMPGTVMFQGCLQALEILLMAYGATLGRDGFRFEPAKNRWFPLRCRGQATPKSRRLVYEVFVDTVDLEGKGPEGPFVRADVLVTVDGLKSLHCKDIQVGLVVDWPLSRRRDLRFPQSTSPLEVLKDGVGGLGQVRCSDGSTPAFDQKALLAIALGRPSDALGAMYAPLDDGRRIPRLPGPPYHFMSRVASVEGSPERPAGSTVVVEYDVPAEAWYFDEGAMGTMPFGVLLEVGLQPCGWLSSYVGSVVSTSTPLRYRNLDGEGTLHREVGPDETLLVTRATLLSESRSGDMILHHFALEVAGPKGKVFTAKTVFGFFPEEALAQQVGLTLPKGDGPSLVPPAIRKEGHATIEGAPGPLLPKDRLRMVDRLVGIGHRDGTTYLRAEKDIRPDQWFFKAHFFQDPVQPGSLGLESILQAGQWVVLLDEAEGWGKEPLRFASKQGPGPIVWKYRGQVTPRNQQVMVDVRVRKVGAYLYEVAGDLYCDGRPIYTASNLPLGLVGRG